MRGSWDLLEMISYRFLWTTFNVLEYGKFLDAQLVRFEDTPAEADRGYLLRLPVHASTLPHSNSVSRPEAQSSDCQFL